MTPTSGTMTVLGETYGETDWRDLQKHIGLVSSSLYQRIERAETALETVVSGRYTMINFWGTITPDDRKKALEVLRRVECEKLAQREWGVLSQGERQRVLIGRALIGNPKLLILDEPCAGLDPAARENFLAFIDRLSQRKSSPNLVLATHHLEEILPLFTHALILKSGRALASGPVAQTLRSEILSEAFNTKLQIEKRNARYHLTIQPRKNLVI